MNVSRATTLLQSNPLRSTFRDDVLRGLSRSPKRLPCKYFYDRRGSILFDAICAQREYYLTRCEQQIMQRHGREMAREVGPGSVVIEFGSGSSVKTRSLLAHLDEPEAYIPVDISREHLLQTAMSLRADFPVLTIKPACADFTDEFALPVEVRRAARRVVYFPGSTIGNFDTTAAQRLLHRIAELVGQGGGLLIGVDLVKDSSVIERAYNDRAGVNAEFNLNLLMRINRELGGEFDLDAFEHLAFYDRRFERVDIRLVSKHDQQVRVGEHQFHFAEGEAIHTELSQKYRIDRFAHMAREAGFGLRQWWTDERQYFAVLSFKNIGFLQTGTLEKFFARTS